MIIIGMTIIKRAKNDDTDTDTEDTDIYPLPRRYIRVLWVVFRGITAITDFTHKHA